MLRISVQPHYTPKGSKKGWICARGTKQTIHKTSSAAAKKANHEMRAHFAAGGASAEYTIFNSKGEKSSVTVYRRKADGSITSESLPVHGTAAAKPAKAKPAKAKPAKGSKGSKGKVNSGLKAFHAFMRAQKAAGKTYAQAQAAWKAEHPAAAAKPKRKKTSKPAAKSSKGKAAKSSKKGGKGKLNAGLKAFHAFMKAQKAAGKSHAQAQAAWTAQSGKASKPKAKPKAKSSKPKAKTSKAKPAAKPKAKASKPKAKRAAKKDSPLPPL